MRAGLECAGVSGRLFRLVIISVVGYSKSLMHIIERRMLADGSVTTTFSHY